MAIGKLAAEFSAGDKGLQDELANIESALKSSGLSASAFAKRFNEGLDSAEKSTGQLMPILDKLQIKIAMLKQAMKFETDPKALQMMGKELKALDIQMLQMTGKTYQAHQRGTRELQQEYHHTASAIFALSMMMGLLSSNTDTGTGKQKIFKDSLEKGVQASLGASFGLMMLGDRFSKLIGPVGIAIGLIVAVASAIRAANEEADKAREEGLKRFGESFEQLPRETQRKMLKDFAERRKAIEAELASITHAYGPAAQFRPLLEFFDTKDAARIKHLKEQDAALAALNEKYSKELEFAEGIDRLEDAGIQILVDQGSAIAKINQEMKELKEEIKTGAKYHGQMALSAEEMQQVVDRLAKLEYDRSRLLMASRDRAMEALNVEKARHALGLSDDRALLARIDATAKFARNEKERLALETERDAIFARRAQFEEDKSRTEEDRVVKGFEARKRLDEITQQASIDAIDNKWQKERAAAKDAHTKRLQQISDEGYASGNIDNAKLAGAAEERRFRLESLNIARNEQAATIDETLQGAGAVASSLQSAFSQAGDTFLSKLGKSLQIALQIARAIQASNAPGAGFGSELGVIGSFINLFSLFGFAKGGHTGSGQRSQVAGVVHKGEVVFEKPLVDVYGGMLMALRSSLQRGYASGGMVGGMLPASARGEIRIIGGKVDVSNGEIALRAWMPGYETWNQKKRP